MEMHSFLHVNISFTGNHLGGSTLEFAGYNSSCVEEGLWLGWRYFWQHLHQMFTWREGKKDLVASLTRVSCGKNNLYVQKFVYFVYILIDKRQ